MLLSLLRDAWVICRSDLSNIVYYSIRSLTVISEWFKATRFGLENLLTLVPLRFYLRSSMERRTNKGSGRSLLVPCLTRPRRFSMRCRGFSRQARSTKCSTLPESNCGKVNTTIPSSRSSMKCKAGSCAQRFGVGGGLY